VKTTQLSRAKNNPRNGMFTETPRTHEGQLDTDRPLQALMAAVQLLEASVDQKG
jgi:hypothetical protein